MNKVRITRFELFQKLGREPLPEEISAYCHIDIEKIEEILRLDTKTVSLDMPIGNEEASFGDFIKDKDGKTPEHETTAAMLAGDCLLYTSPSPRDRTRSRMPSSA